MSLHPEVKWAQRPDVVYLTVMLPDAKDPKVKLDPEGVFNFSANAGAGDRHYELKLELQDKVNVEESKISTGVRSIFCVLQKAEPKWWTKLLRGDGKAPHYVKVDWDKWVDEDDEPEAGPGDMDFNNMDFSKFGDMGGMGGMMGGMGGMGGMMGGMGDMMGGMGGDMGDDLDDSDDEEQEVTKPSAKAAETVDAKPKGEDTRYKLLPRSRERPITRFHPDGEATLVGLGCDLMKQKYNVVLAGYHRSFGHRPERTFICMVYDSESNKWRKFVSLQDDQFTHMNKNQVVFIKGGLHWLTDSCSCMLVLDLSTDVWKKILLPRQ